MRKFVIVALAIMSSGCNNLSESGLIYSSENNVGVDVSLPATGNGLSLNVGYKQLDFAYVPVAVSNCTKNTAQCTDKPTMVYGRSGNGKSNSEGLDPQLLKDTLSASIAANKKLADKIGASAPSGEIADAKKDADHKKQVLDVLIRHDSDLQTDAKSVFGRFEGNIQASGGASANANVALGKMFSTGIAAQNLSRDVYRKERINSVTDCLNLAKNLATNKQVASATVDMAVKACSE